MFGDVVFDLLRVECVETPNVDFCRDERLVGIGIVAVTVGIIESVVVNLAGFLSRMTGK